MKNFLILLCLFLSVVFVRCVSHHKPTDIIDKGCVIDSKITRATFEANQKSLFNCNLNRSDVVEFARVFDLNRDLAIGYDECVKIREHYVPEIARSIVESCDEVFRRCDCDGDGYITNDDFDRSIPTCLRDCPSLNKVNDLIIKNMKDKTNPFSELVSQDTNTDYSKFK